MVDVFPQMLSAMTFRNVAWNRDGAPLKLSRQTKPLILRKRFGEFIDDIYEIHSSLPNGQVTVRSHLGMT